MTGRCARLAGHGLGPPRMVASRRMLSRPSRYRAGSSQAARGSGSAARSMPGSSPVARSAGSGSAWASMSISTRPEGPAAAPVQGSMCHQAASRAGSVVAARTPWYHRPAGRLRPRAPGWWRRRGSWPGAAWRATAAGCASRPAPARARPPGRAAALRRARRAAQPCSLGWRGIHPVSVGEHSGCSRWPGKIGTSGWRQRLHRGWAMTALLREREGGCFGRPARRLTRGSSSGRTDRRLTRWRAGAEASPRAAQAGVECANRRIGDALSRSSLDGMVAPC